MNKRKRWIVTLFLGSLLMAGPSLWAKEASEAQAEIAAYKSEGEQEASKPWYKPDFTWNDVNINYLDWSDGSERRGAGNYDDFPYIELEGGAGWGWGEFYFFTDWENPGKGFDADKAPRDSRWVIKPILDINIPKAKGWMKNVQLHIQDYYLYGKTFHVNNLVIGLAYKYISDNFFMRPFVGLHYMHDSFHESLWNGYMGGWVFNYDFRLFNQKFSLSNWHEFEWDRDESTYLNPDGSRQPFGDRSSWGVQGALAAWWHVNEHFSGGVQYRYAWHKLGSYDYLTGVIYTLKYNF
ncbi:outer membrane protein OmpK [Hydrogenimonas urashimensis]|uniref:outer membrane protein OmpK n=1 Tax=Hydrogenimonas urashimensis TaxID=2740515 RepID=UPI001915167D|nr:outer membrane protein OmpK [Hydrogenimonas urashimensis]